MIVVVRLHADGGLADRFLQIRAGADIAVLEGDHYAIENGRPRASHRHYTNAEFIVRRIRAARAAGCTWLRCGPGSTNRTKWNYESGAASEVRIRNRRSDARPQVMPGHEGAAIRGGPEVRSMGRGCRRAAANVAYDLSCKSRCVSSPQEA